MDIDLRGQTFYLKLFVYLFVSFSFLFSFSPFLFFNLRRRNLPTCSIYLYDLFKRERWRYVFASIIGIIMALQCISNDNAISIIIDRPRNEEPTTERTET